MVITYGGTRTEMARATCISILLLRQQIACVIEVPLAERPRRAQGGPLSASKCSQNRERHSRYTAFVRNIPSILLHNHRQRMTVLARGGASLKGF